MSTLLKGFKEREGSCDAPSLWSVSTSPSRRLKTRKLLRAVLTETREPGLKKKKLFLAVLGLHSCEGFSLVVVSEGYSSLWWVSFSLQWLPLLCSTCSGCTGFSSCSSRAPSMVSIVVYGLSCPVAHGIRDGTSFSGVSRWILYHWATKEAPRTRSLYAFSVVTESRYSRKGVILGKEALSS